MPATDFQGSSSPLVSFGRSIVGNRRDHGGSATASTTPMDGGRVGLDELEAFQQLVAELFHGLGGGDDDDDEEEEEKKVLSLRWVRKLLETFLVCQEEFGKILAGNKAALSKPPLDRLTSEFFERSVKALDVCNAIRDGIDHVRNWVKHLEIVRVALDPKQRSLGEGQFRRAKKALTDLTIAMLDEKEAASSSSVFAHRNRSFGQNNRENQRSAAAVAAVHFRSLSWSVSRNWSAARQLQAIGSNLAAPRSNEIIATNGLVVPIFTMNSVLLFVMWALVAAIPCQDRGLQMHFSIPRGFVWAPPLLALHDRIMEESKKRSRKNSNGLLGEIHRIEKCSRHLTQLMHSVQLPLAKDRESEFRAEVEELAKICGALKGGLDPLEQQVREVFRRIVRGRTEGLDSLGTCSGRRH